MPCFNYFFLSFDAVSSFSAFVLDGFEDDVETMAPAAGASTPITAPTSAGASAAVAVRRGRDIPPSPQADDIPPPPPKKPRKHKQIAAAPEELEQEEEELINRPIYTPRWHFTDLDIPSEDPGSAGVLMRKICFPKEVEFYNNKPLPEAADLGYQGLSRVSVFAVIFPFFVSLLLSNSGYFRPIM